jgi:hypothetical protein
MEEKICPKEIMRVLDNYINRLRSKIKTLPKSEQKEILDEIRSDILTKFILKGKRIPRDDSNSFYQFLKN